MGVVHLARRRRRRPGRAQGPATPHRRRRRSATSPRARGRVAATGAQPLGRRDRRRRPVGGHPVRRDPLRAGPLAARPDRRARSDHGLRPLLARGLPRRGRRLGARCRRPAPRREAVQRADGGPHPDPHRLRARPRRRRPQAHPHRLAARHARLPRARDPLRRGRDRRLRRPLLGRHRRLRGARSSAVRTRPVDGHHGPGPARAVRPVRAAGGPPSGRRRRARPRAPAPADLRPAARLAAAADDAARADAHGPAGRASSTIPTRSRWRWPPRPPPTTRPTSGPATTPPNPTRWRSRRTATRPSTRRRPRSPPASGSAAGPSWSRPPSWPVPAVRRTPG